MSSPERWVLLVDDEKSVRTVAQRMLERHGYEVVAVAGGREALDALRQHDDAFGVVLLDWTMPGMDGGETCERLRQIRPGIPVVFMSGDGAVEIARRSGPGTTCILRKPFSRASLTESIAAVC